MKIIAIIPARYKSTRFEGKPLALICGKPMIQWVYESVNCVPELDDTYVATDDERIKECVEGFGGKCLMTSSYHQCGTDRITECAGILNLVDDDIVINIQGDEPLIDSKMVKELIDTLLQGGNNADMSTLCEKIEKEEDIVNPNIVKVISDINGKAIYFSRSVIPYNRNNIEHLEYYRHIGVYAYRTRFLVEFSKMDKSSLELAESLEQLRAIQNGCSIYVGKTVHASVGVDTVEQLHEVENELLQNFPNKLTNGFEVVSRFLAENNLLEIPTGKYELGCGCSVNIDDYTTVDFFEKEFEVHKKYIDVQYMVFGEEILYISTEKKGTFDSFFDEVNDIGFAHLSDNSKMQKNQLNSGELLVIYPGQYHKPCIALEEKTAVKKAVFKIPVDL